VRREDSQSLALVPALKKPENQANSGFAGAVFVTGGIQWQKKPLNVNVASD